MYRLEETKMVKKTETSEDDCQSKGDQLIIAVITFLTPIDTKTSQKRRKNLRILFSKTY